MWLDRENYEVLQLEIDLKDVVELIVRAELEAYGYGDADAKMKSVLFRMRIDETGRSYGITVPEAAQQQANSDDRLSDLIAKMTQGDFYGLQ